MTAATPEIKQKVQQLRQQLQKAGYAYYVLDNPLMEDAVYDRLYRQLQDLEGQYPELITPDSPTQRVGDRPASKFKRRGIVRIVRTFCVISSPVTPSPLVTPLTNTPFS